MLKNILSPFCLFCSQLPNFQSQQARDVFRVRKVETVAGSAEGSVEGCGHMGWNGVGSFILSLSRQQSLITARMKLPVLTTDQSDAKHGGV